MATWYEDNMSQVTMFRSSAREALPGSIGATLTAVTFAIGTQEYGLPVADVLEIVPLPAMLSLVGAPAYLAGLLNRRGRYLPVLDSRVLVDEPVQYDLDRYIIIAGRPSASSGPVVPMLGLIVDRVSEVCVFESANLTPLSSAVVAPFLRSVVRSADRSVLLFDLEPLLALTPSIGVDVTLQ